MSTQFRIAVDERDEQRLCEFLRDRWQAMCAPRFSMNPQLEAVPVGQCSSPEQVVFPADLLALVQGRVAPVVGRDGEFHVYPKAGACLEWTRAQARDRNVIPGRFYLDASPGGGAEGRRLKNMMKELLAFVEKESPLVSKDKVPIFVGRSLSERVSRGDAQVLYGGGSPVSFESAGE
ncbi:hypothetical protein [Corallococcus interemptor]|uniref:hypothetical protein n=1 Tax=Corallococcus interemptor TaxID=2316720 RepID=UPI0011C45C04|nr:hypothetical protein [Corallococcus interemptor]